LKKEIAPIMPHAHREGPKKNRPLLADLSSYHDGALSGGRVENPLSFATSDCLTAGRLIYHLCRGANRGNGGRIEKVQAGNQVLRMTWPH
jgi:hypothetical protein